MTTTQAFPTQEVIGCKFEATEGYHSYRGVVDRVAIEDGYIRLHTRDVEEEHPARSDQWSKSSEPRGSFGFNQSAGGGSWHIDSGGNLQVSVTYIGHFTIFLPKH